MMKHYLFQTFNILDDYLIIVVGYIMLIARCYISVNFKRAKNKKYKESTKLYERAFLLGIDEWIENTYLANKTFIFHARLIDVIVFNLRFSYYMLSLISVIEIITLFHMHINVYMLSFFSHFSFLYIIIIFPLICYLDNKLQFRKKTKKRKGH